MTTTNTLSKGAGLCWPVMGFASPDWSGMRLPDLLWLLSHAAELDLIFVSGLVYPIRVCLAPSDQLPFHAAYLPQVAPQVLH